MKSEKSELKQLQEFYKIAIETLESIASNKRNTKEKRLAKAALIFIDSLARQSGEEVK